MFVFQQSRGALMRDGLLIGVGYSGKGTGLNNPNAQAIRKFGPIPQGKYHIGTACVVAHLGPCAMELRPNPSNIMWDRSGFFIHGDNEQMNFTGSEGCIILRRDVRERIAASGDIDLTVIA